MKGIGYCGVDCDACELVDELEETARRAAELNSDIIRMKVSAWAPTVLEGGSSIDFPALEKTLTWMADMLTCPGCIAGGGQQGCQVRHCSKEKGFENCSQCSGLMECTKFEDKTEPDKIKERLLIIRSHS
jgi:hypothetical protein